MAIMKIVGFKPYAFQKDGENVEGCNVFLLDENPTNENTVGCECEKISLSKKKIVAFLDGRGFVDVLNINVVPIYNRYGRVDVLQIC